METAKKILIVDDDEGCRETIATILREMGYAVDTAANGSLALDYLNASEAPGMIFLDLMMPVMNGWELREQLKREPRLAAIPVVVLSAGNNVARMAGLEGVRTLEKPIDIGDLMATVEGVPGVGLAPT